MKVYKIIHKNLDVQRQYKCNASTFSTSCNPILQQQTNTLRNIALRYSTGYTDLGIKTLDSRYGKTYESKWHL